MAYNDNELSVRGGAPRELYKFVGTYATYCYTSATKRIRYPDTALGDWYEPVTLDRSEINAGTPEDDGLNFSVQLPVTAEVSRVYAFSDAPPDLDLKVFRFHTIDAVVPYWSGQVSDISIDDGMVTFTVPSGLATALQGSVTDVLYQGPCNHVLYDARCGVVYEDYSLIADVLSIEDKVFTVDGLAALDGMLIGGELVLSSGERRMIVEQNGNALTLNFALQSAKVGDPVTIAAGCDYAWSGDCKTKFANQLRFGGFPFIPDDNVFETGIDPGSRLPDATCVATCVSEGWYLQMTWSAPTAPNHYPLVFSASFPQSSGVFPGGAFFEAGKPFNRNNLNGNFVIEDVAGGWNILDFGPNPEIIMQYRWIMNGDACQGYRWEFNFPLDNTGINWSHQFSFDAFPNGGGDALIEVGAAGKVIATKVDFVGRLFPYDYGINY